jgi:transposase
MDGPEKPQCPGCQELSKRLKQLEAQVTDLIKQLDEARRAGKRQAAPFRKGKPKTRPKPPGRKPNDGGAHAYRTIPSPDHVDETLEAELPDACPHCQGDIAETEITTQFQTEIPRKPLVRQFNVHVGRCNCCGQRVQGRHPLQTSDALGAAASQIGPDAQAAAALLHTQIGLSHGKVTAVFQALFGFSLTRGASAQINQRAATRLKPDYHLILDTVRRSTQIAADETGWRIGGRSAWLHVWVGDEATAYAIDSQRSADALEGVIGRDWAGILSHDGYATYDRFYQAIHQQCVAHVLRRAQDLREVAKGGAVHFPKRLLTLFREAVHWRNQYLRDTVTLESVQEQREAFDDRLIRLLRRTSNVPAYATFTQHLWKHLEQWFTFLFNPHVEATNWKAEQAIRPAVVNRKVWGGNRTTLGARAQEVLMSVMETCRRQTRSAVDYLSQTLRWFGNLLLPKPQLLLGR